MNALTPTKVIFVVGPTASGKSALAISLAKKLNGAIVSADSMQIYKGMDIGTAKPGKSELRLVPHHCIDIVTASKKFSVYEYRRHALRAIKQIVKNGKTPIVVGGTGLYVRALLQGLTEQPAVDKELRLKAEKDLERYGVAYLYKKLKAIDKSAAQAIDDKNPRRVLRALEITAAKKKGDLRSLRHLPSLEEMGYQTQVFALNPSRETLYKRINKRVDLMFRRGLLREVKKLSKHKLSETAMQAVGYKEILIKKPSRAKRGGVAGSKDLVDFATLKSNARNEVKDGGGEANTHLRANTLRIAVVNRNDAGQCLQTIKEQIKQNTRRYAKRQWTWFKKERNVKWIWMPDGATITSVRDFVLKLICGR